MQWVLQLFQDSTHGEEEEQLGPSSFQKQHNYYTNPCKVIPRPTEQHAMAATAFKLQHAAAITAFRGTGGSQLATATQWRQRTSHSNTVEAGDLSKAFARPARGGLMGTCGIDVFEPTARGARARPKRAHERAGAARG